MIASSKFCGKGGVKGMKGGFACCIVGYFYLLTDCSRVRTKDFALCATAEIKKYFNAKHLHRFAAP